MIIPIEFQNDLDIAISVLKAAGTTEIFLFGSLTSEHRRSDSDIDLAVCGLQADKFFEVYSRAAKNLVHELDLVDLDHEVEFASFLRETNRLVRIA